MNEDDDVLAANHVLGLLGAAAESDALRRVQVDEAFAAAVAFWSDRFEALETAAPVDPHDRLWSRIETAIDEADKAPGTRTIRLEDGVWEMFGDGIERKVLFIDRSAGTQAYYVRMAAGAVLPTHSHDMNEHCVLLSGRLLIGGVEVNEGDFHVGYAGAAHQPITALTKSLFFIHGAI